MAQYVRFPLLVTIFALVLTACIPNTPTPTEEPPGILPPEGAALELAVSVDTSITYNAVNQIITYTYTIRNTGSTPLAGPATVADDKATTSCAEVTTVGNQDTNLDPAEEVTCTGTYAIAQTDLDAGTVTNNSTATLSGVNSNLVSTAVNMTRVPALTLTKAANPLSYTEANQIITYTYVIINTGNVTLDGPFSVADDKTTPNCPQPEDGFLSPQEEMSCTSTYTITQADVNLGQVTNNASASNGTITSANAPVTVNRSGTVPPQQPPVVGESRQHTTIDGEWLWQIARCYGADPKEVINANLRWYNPAKLMPGVVVNVPNVGSVGPVIGPPCLYSHTVVAGDTWASIAGQYSNVDVNFIQRSDVNPGGLVPGTTVRVPVGPENYP